jgi:hypothetical protein
VAIVFLSMVAVPSAAPADATPGRPLAAAAAASGASLTPAAAARAAQAPATAAPAPESESRRPFFKTPAGVVALALMAGSVGYAVYSFSNGRVKSPAK